MELLFLISAICTAGISMLWQYCILPNQIFGRVQTLLVWLEPRSEFWYKRLGGCHVCNLQLFVDIVYWALALIMTSYAWYVLLFWYIMYSGLTFYFYFLVGGQTKQPHPKFKTETENIEL